MIHIPPQAIVVAIPIFFLPENDLDHHIGICKRYVSPTWPRQHDKTWMSHSGPYSQMGETERSHRIAAENYEANPTLAFSPSERREGGRYLARNASQ